MNECFLIGKIIGKIEFEFIINNKSYISISMFDIMINKENILKVVGYNNIADFCYKTLKRGDIVSIYGNLNSKGKVEIKEIET